MKIYRQIENSLLKCYCEFFDNDLKLLEFNRIQIFGNDFISYKTFQSQDPNLEFLFLKTIFTDKNNILRDIGDLYIIDKREQSCRLLINNVDIIDYNNDKFLVKKFFEKDSDNFDICYIDCLNGVTKNIINLKFDDFNIINITYGKIGQKKAYLFVGKTDKKFFYLYHLYLYDLETEKLYKYKISSCSEPDIYVSQDYLDGKTDYIQMFITDEQKQSKTFLKIIKINNSEKNIYTIPVLSYNVFPDFEMSKRIFNNRNFILQTWFKNEEKLLQNKLEFNKCIQTETKYFIQQENNKIYIRDINSKKIINIIDTENNFFIPMQLFINSENIFFITSQNITDYNIKLCLYDNIKKELKIVGRINIADLNKNFFNYITYTNVISCLYDYCNNKINYFFEIDQNNRINLIFNNKKEIFMLSFLNKCFMDNNLYIAKDNKNQCFLLKIDQNNKTPIKIMCPDIQVKNIVEIQNSANYFIVEDINKKYYLAKINNNILNIVKPLLLSRLNNIFLCNKKKYPECVFISNNVLLIISAQGQNILYNTQNDNFFISDNVCLNHILKNDSFKYIPVVDLNNGTVFIYDKNDLKQVLKYENNNNIISLVLFNAYPDSYEWFQHEKLIDKIQSIFKNFQINNNKNISTKIKQFKI